MKNSTILGIGLLSVVGVGAYIYLKGKKTTTPISSSTTSTNTTSDTSSSVVNSSLGSPTSSVVNNSLGLPTTKSPSAEEQKNYLEAKRIAGNMKEINYMGGAKNKPNANTWALPNDFGGSWYYPIEVLEQYSRLAEQKVTSSTTIGRIPPLKPAKSDLLANMTTKVNALGYKVLPNFDIEKM
jgi:hypothetical protein